MDKPTAPHPPRHRTTAKQYGNRAMTLNLRRPTISASNCWPTTPRVRETALEKNDKTILPALVNLVRSDNDINVVAKAVAQFNAITQQSFDFWKTRELLDWWEKNKVSYQ
jgi:hypothetical protein